MLILIIVGQQIVPKDNRAEIQTWDLLYLAAGRHANNLATPHSHWSSYGPDFPTALAFLRLTGPDLSTPYSTIIFLRLTGPDLPKPAPSTSHWPWPSYALFDHNLHSPHWPWPSYALFGHNLPTPHWPWHSYASPALTFLRLTPNLTTPLCQHFLKTTG